MGITGLLPNVQNVLTATNISKFSHKRIAVDGYSWLHKGVYGCSIDLAMGKENYSWIKYCLKFIDMLLSFHIKVIMVFDGSNLPSKQDTEIDRAKKRLESKQKALDMLSSQKSGSGNTSTLKMMGSFSNSVDVTPEMAAQLIHILKRHRPSVECIVSPYEADAQLAYLSHHKIIDLVLTEDSDTIPYGCSEIIFKLDKAGSCQHLILNDLFDSEKAATSFNLSEFSLPMMTGMCIASGCDYLQSCKGVGTYRYMCVHM